MRHRALNVAEEVHAHLDEDRHASGVFEHRGVARRRKVDVDDGVGELESLFDRPRRAIELEVVGAIASGLGNECCLRITVAHRDRRAEQTRAERVDRELVVGFGRSCFGEVGRVDLADVVEASVGARCAGEDRLGGATVHGDGEADAITSGATRWLDAVHRTIGPTRIRTCEPPAEGRVVVEDADFAAEAVRTTDSDRVTGDVELVVRRHTHPVEEQALEDHPIGPLAGAIQIEDDELVVEATQRRRNDAIAIDCHGFADRDGGLGGQVRLERERAKARRAERSGPGVERDRVGVGGRASDDTPDRNAAFGGFGALIDVDGVAEELVVLFAVALGEEADAVVARTARVPFEDFDRAAVDSAAGVVVAGDTHREQRPVGRDGHVVAEVEGAGEVVGEVTHDRSAICPCGTVVLVDRNLACRTRRADGQEVAFEIDARAEGICVVRLGGVDDELVERPRVRLACAFVGVDEAVERLTLIITRGAHGHPVAADRDRISEEVEGRRCARLLGREHAREARARGRDLTGEGAATRIGTNKAWRARNVRLVGARRTGGYAEAVPVEAGCGRPVGGQL